MKLPDIVPILIPILEGRIRTNVDERIDATGKGRTASLPLLVSLDVGCNAASVFDDLTDYGKISGGRGSNAGFIYIGRDNRPKRTATRYMPPPSPPLSRGYSPLGSGE